MGREGREEEGGRIGLWGREGAARGGRGSEESGWRVDGGRV